MSNRTRTALAMCVAALALALVAGAASADRALGIAPGGAIEAVSEGVVTFFAKNGEFTVTCRTTFRGELRREVMKVGGTRMGEISEGTTAECRTSNREPATVTLLVERAEPFSINYGTFLGTLPELITGIQAGIPLFRFQVNAGLLRCLYQGALAILILFPPGEEGGGTRFNRVRFVTPNNIPTTTMMCPREAEVRGELRLTPAQRLTLR